MPPIHLLYFTLLVSFHFTVLVPSVAEMIERCLLLYCPFVIHISISGNLNGRYTIGESGELWWYVGIQ
jgi:hypothetical protein